MDTLLFIGMMYLYLVMGIFTSAIAYIEDRTTNTIGMQYFKVLIVLLLWPLFLIGSPRIHKEVKGMIKNTFTTVDKKPNPFAPFNNKKNEPVNTLTSLLDEKFLFNAPVVNALSATQSLALLGDKNTETNIESHRASANTALAERLSAADPVETPSLLSR